MPEGAGQWWAVLQLGSTALAVASIPSVLLRRRGRPMAALSWILVLVALPVLGVALWWLLGRMHLERQRRRRRRAHERLAPALTAVRDRVRAPAARPVLGFCRLPDHLRRGIFPASAGNRCRLLVDATTAYPEMERAIEAARHHVHALFYIWRDDATGRRFRDLLCAKAREGVEVRALYDGIGSLGLSHAYKRALRDAGVQVATFLPLGVRTLRAALNFRNHRKILVVDAERAFVGGINIGDEYTRDWHDLAVELRGPVVDQLQEVFADDWHYAAREDLASADYFGKSPAVDGADAAECAVIASGPDFPAYNPTHEALFAAVVTAQSRLWIMTPYFVPGPALMAALRSAAFRGVDVRLYLPRRSDVRLVEMAARSYYPDLLDAGIRVFEYLPGFLHAKAAIVDESLAFLGSANLDARSFRLNFEASCFVTSASFVAQLAAMMAADEARCSEITRDYLAAQPAARQIVDAAAHLLSPLL
ncbi:MAG: cardiolipin synthase [Deltaproteobacteria bacterium]|nr:MAG: cardiolipin synthase [Deltaproteobacteria bacterium]